MAARASAGLVLFRLSPVPDGSPGPEVGEGPADGPPRRPTGLGGGPDLATVEVLLGHMGGPFWSRKDAGAWTIPKGELDVRPDGTSEEPHAAAVRETTEELGVEPPAVGGDVPLGTVRQKAGKTVTAWARRVPDGWDLPEPGRPSSNTFTLEWPPRSGRVQEFGELDRARWVGLDEARTLVVAGQVELLDRLAATLPDQTRPDAP